MLVLQRRISALDTVYDHCPSYCGLENKRNKSGFCNGCPLIKEDNEFKNSTLKELDTDFGEEWKTWSFENLQQSVSDVMILEQENDPDSWDITTSLLVKVLQRERDKLDRADRESEKKKWQDILNRGNKNNGRR